MPIPVKSPAEIASMRDVGRRAWGLLQEVASACGVGMTTREIESLARERIAAAGLHPVMLGYRAGNAPPFTGAASICLNEEVVHAGPSDRIVRRGDVVSVDLAVSDEAGWFADAATSFIAGGEGPRAAAGIVELARRALRECIEGVGPWVWWSQVAAKAHTLVRAAGCHLAAGYTGHGIGRGLHEPPRLCFGPASKSEDCRLLPGMVVTLEPLVVEGPLADLVTLDDGWTVVAGGRQLSAHEEVTVAITRSGREVLTA